MLLLEERWEPTLTAAEFGYSFQVVSPWHYQDWTSAMVELSPWHWAWMTVLSALGMTERRLCGITVCNTLISALCLSYQPGRQVNKMDSFEAPFDNFTVTARENSAYPLDVAELLVLVRKHCGIAQWLSSPTFWVKLHLLTFQWTTPTAFQRLLLKSFSCSKILVTVIVMVMHL